MKQRLTRTLLGGFVLLITLGLLACGGGGGSSSASKNANLSDLVLSAAGLDQAFQSSQLDYTATVNFLTASTTVTATTEDDAATVTVNGAAVTPGSASAPVALGVGDTLIRVTVTAANNNTTRTYNVTVSRESADDFAQRAYIKASNPDPSDSFGYRVTLSGDTLAVGAPGEDSNATGIDGDGGDNSLNNAGAVYVFVNDGTQWSQQAYIKASNSGDADLFGTSVALKSDTLAVGAPGEDSNATGIDGNENDNNLNNAGAVYVFVRNGTQWNQQAYIKASNTGQADNFGFSLALSSDSLVVGAPGEDSSATGVGGSEGNNSMNDAGAVYVFFNDGTQWRQQAYIKASNTDPSDSFGYSVGLSGNYLSVGAIGEDSSATGINGIQNDNSLSNAGAVYAFVRSGSQWSQQAYIKASNSGDSDLFGTSMVLRGATLVAGATGENSSATGINGDQDDNSLINAGAVYAFVRNNSQWRQQAYIKASNSDNSNLFGASVALSNETLVVGAIGENSNARGINGDQGDNSLVDAGAVYAFARNGSQWRQLVYIKASNSGNSDLFGSGVALTGAALVVGAPGEDSSATGIDGDQSDNSMNDAGAGYAFQ